jgi:hypothetical protein
MRRHKRHILCNKIAKCEGEALKSFNALTALRFQKVKAIGKPNKNR